MLQEYECSPSGSCGHRHPRGKNTMFSQHMTLTRKCGDILKHTLMTTQVYDSSEYIEVK